MRNLKKQLNTISALIETILQARLEPSQISHRNLGELHKKISLMNETQNYDEAITQMLIDMQQYQIRNRVNEFVFGEEGRKCGQLSLGVYLEAVRKEDGDISNAEFWEFGVEFKGDKEKLGEEGRDVGFVQVIEHVVRNLRCFSLFPVDNEDKAIRNKYIFNHKVTIQEKPSLKVQKNNFQNISCHEAVFQSTHSEGILRITTKYHYNNSKFEQLLHNRVSYRKMSLSQDSRKSSADTIDSSRQISIFEHHDNELEITVLSSFDLGENNCEEIFIDLDKESESQEFQLLIEETEGDDEMFLKSNLAFLKELQL